MLQSYVSRCALAAMTVLFLALVSASAHAQRKSSWLTDRGFPEIEMISKTKQASAQACRDLCLTKSNCEAWSFFEGAVCHLSSSKIITMMNLPGRIAGFVVAADLPKEFEPTAMPVVSGPQRTSSWLTDKRPGMYTGDLPETKQPSAEMCRNRCLQNQQCKGWSFRYASQARGLEASIKDCRLSTQWFNGYADQGVISGEITGAAAESHRTAAVVAPIVSTTPVAAAPTPAPAAPSVAPVTNPVVAALPPTAAAANPGRRVALVIGNSAYKAVAALPNPQRDADSVAAALRRTGFQSVTLASDLTREKLIDALRSFAAEAEKADWALVYFAGHGIEIGGVNYLIPVDAKLAADRDVQFEAVPLEQVMGAAEGAKKFRLVLLDACRDNPFAGQMRRTVATRSIGRGLAQVEPDSGTLVVYAAKHGQTALDGDGANSPFVSAFVRRLAMPGLEIRKLFDLVRDDVMSATNRRQQPYSYGSVPGSEDFFFVAAK